MPKKSDQKLAAVKRLIQKYEKKLETLKEVLMRPRIEAALKIAQDYAENLKDGNYELPELDNEPILEEPPPLAFVFATLPSISTPPFEGYLIPAKKEEQSVGKQIRVRYEVEFKGHKGLYVPAIKIHITGNYVGTFTNASITFSVGYVPFHTLQKCTVITASHKPWVDAVWKLAWKDEFGAIMYVIKPGDSGKSVLSKFGGLMGSHETDYDGEIDPDQTLIADPFLKKYLAMMLLWDFFWNCHPEYTNEGRNDDLKALKLVKYKSDHRSFMKECSRAGIYFPKPAGGIAPLD